MPNGIDRQAADWDEIATLKKKLNAARTRARQLRRQVKAVADENVRLLRVIDGLRIERNAALRQIRDRENAPRDAYDYDRIQDSLRGR